MQDEEAFATDVNAAQRNPSVSEERGQIGPSRRQLARGCAGFGRDYRLLLSMFMRPPLAAPYNAGFVFGSVAAIAALLTRFRWRRVDACCVVCGTVCFTPPRLAASYGLRERTGRKNLGVTYGRVCTIASVVTIRAVYHINNRNKMCDKDALRHFVANADYSTVTDFARLRGLSMSQPFFSATW